MSFPRVWTLSLTFSSRICLWTAILSLFSFRCLCASKPPMGRTDPSIFTTLPMRTQAARWNVGRETIRISWHISQRKQSNDMESGWPHDWLSIHVFISLSSPADKCFKRLTVLRNDLILWWMCHTVPPIWTWCKDRTGLFMIMMQTANDTKNCCVSLCDP